MNPLQQFLSENAAATVEPQEVHLNGRLKDFMFKVRAMTGDQYNSYQSACIENPSSPKKRKFNTKRFNEMIVVNHVVEPCFKDAEWLRQMGMSDPAALMYKVMLAGEIDALAQKILSVSGFNLDPEEEIEEAKN